MLKTSVIEVLRHVMHNSSKELENNTSAANTECITSASFIPSYDNEVDELLEILEVPYHTVHTILYILSYTYLLYITFCTVEMLGMYNNIIY